MKLFLSTIAVGTMSLFFCTTAAPAHGWQEPDEKKQEPEKKKEPEKKPQEPRPEERKGEQQKPEARPENNRQPEANRGRQEQEKQPQEERGRAQQPENRGENAHAQAHGNARLTEHTGHHNSFRIPDDRFHASFGREHRFHVHRGERTFVFGGFDFELVDPWPANWAFDDDVFVEFIDGEYYLVDLEHPELRVLVIVVS